MPGVTVFWDRLSVSNRLGSVLLGLVAVALYVSREFRFTDSLQLPIVRHSFFESLQNPRESAGERQLLFPHSNSIPFESSFTEVSLRSSGDSDDEEEEAAGSDEDAPSGRKSEEKGQEKEADEGKRGEQSDEGEKTEEAKGGDEHAEGSHASEEADRDDSKESADDSERDGGEEKEHPSEKRKSVETKKEVAEKHERDGETDTSKKESKEETKERKKDKFEKKSGGEKATPPGDESEHDELMNKLRKLIGGTTGTQMLDRLRAVITEHEKEEKRRAAEEESRQKAEAAKRKEEEKHKEEEKKREAEELRKKQEEERKQAPAKDLLLTQQLTALWMLPFLHDKTRVDTCLSGFEKLAQQSRLTCSDPACMKLEQDPNTCAFLDVHSIDRPHDSADHSTALHLGFDAQCKSASSLGAQVLKLLQHPVKQYQAEQKLESVGVGAGVPPITNHLDLVCESSDSAKHPTCNAITQALRNVPHIGPKNLPSMLVLTDIVDIPNTLGLFRIAVIFEGRVPVLNSKGQLVDRTGAKLPDAAARQVYSNLHRLRQGLRQDG